MWLSKYMINRVNLNLYPPFLPVLSWLKYNECYGVWNLIFCIQFSVDMLNLTWQYQDDWLVKKMPWSEMKGLKRLSISLFFSLSLSLSLVSLLSPLFLILLLSHLFLFLLSFSLLFLSGGILGFETRVSLVLFFSNSLSFPTIKSSRRRRHTYGSQIQELV